MPLAGPNTLPAPTLLPSATGRDVVVKAGAPRTLRTVRDGLAYERDLTARMLQVDEGEAQLLDEADEIE